MTDLEDLANTEVIFTYDNGEAIRLPFIMAWSIYRTRGYRPVFEIAMLGAQIANQHINPNTKLPREVEEETRRVVMMLHDAINRHQTPEDLLCFFAYQLLSGGLANRTEVAQLASYLLERPIESDTWRKRLDKYIEAHKLKRLTLAQGRRASKPGK